MCLQQLNRCAMSQMGCLSAQNLFSPWQRNRWNDSDKHIESTTIAIAHTTVMVMVKHMVMVSQTASNNIESKERRFDSNELGSNQLQWSINFSKSIRCYKGQIIVNEDSPGAIFVHIFPKLGQPKLRTDTSLLRFLITSSTDTSSFIWCFAPRWRCRS